jgi:hypothetical protein
MEKDLRQTGQNLKQNEILIDQGKNNAFCLRLFY